MIQSNELRLGNLVMYGDVQKVISIGLEKVTLSDKFMYFYPEYAFIQPIPITEEWLIRLGFSKVTYGYFKMYTNKEEYYLEYVAGSYHFFLDNKSHVFRKITDIHQLQNIYFALTGEELIINQNGSKPN